MNEESTSSFAAFPGTPTVDEFMKVVQKRSAPPVGATPEQVRAHYAGKVEAPTVVEIPSPMTAAQYQNTTPPAFHSEETGVSVELPSQFVFYDFKELYVHTFRGKHLAKLARAAKEKNVRLLAEVMSSVLTVPGSQTGGLAFQLTLPDWYWLLYFQRKNCYTKVSFIHKFRCNNPKHIQEVLDGHKAPETLINKAKIDTSTLEVTPFEPFPLSENLQQLGAHCPTVGDFVLTVEDKRFGNDDEYEFNAQIACLIYPNLPWEQRLRAVDELSAEQIAELKEYEAKVTAFGVKEKANVICKECGASTETILSVDASSFLPSA